MDQKNGGFTAVRKILNILSAIVFCYPTAAKHDRIILIYFLRIK